MLCEVSSELWLAIFRLCNESALLQLSLVSEAFRALCLPLIYRDVDLSTHNSDIPHPLYLWLDITAAGLARILEAKKSTKQLHRAQESFLRTVLHHPEYAAFTRTLIWTLMFGPELDDQESPIEHVVHPHNQTWQVLLSLNNVRHLDLASEHCLMRYPYVRNCPGPLFPAATSVRLSGIMDEKLVGNTIFHRPERLEEISIDNVQHWGLHADGRPLTDDGPDLDRMEEPGIYPLGPIRDIFDSSRRYSNLKTLFLRKAGSRYVQGERWVPEADIAVYKEWASLITAVKGFLRHLTFEQADPPSGWFVRSCCHQTRRPMDQRFHDYLFPVFLEGGWTCLERLEIRGVGRWQREEPIVMNDSAKDAIADAVGPNVQLIIEEEARRPAFLWDPPSY